MTLTLCILSESKLGPSNTKLEKLQLQLLVFQDVTLTHPRLGKMMVDFLQPQPAAQSGQALICSYAVGKCQVQIQNFCTKNPCWFLPCELTEEGLSCQQGLQIKLLQVMVANSFWQ